MEESEDKKILRRKAKHITILSPDCVIKATAVLVFSEGNQYEKKG